MTEKLKDLYKIMLSFYVEIHIRYGLLYHTLVEYYFLDYQIQLIAMKVQTEIEIKQLMGLFLKDN